MAKRKTNTDERLDLVFEVQVTAGFSYSTYIVIAKDLEAAARIALSKSAREGMVLPHVEQIRRHGIATYA